jgi:hypothetical protein
MKRRSHAQTIFFLFHKTFFYFLFISIRILKKRKKEAIDVQRERLNPHRPSGLIGPERIAKLGLNIKENGGKKVRV